MSRLETPKINIITAKKDLNSSQKIKSIKYVRLMNTRTSSLKPKNRSTSTSTQKQQSPSSTLRPKNSLSKSTKV